MSNVSLLDIGRLPSINSFNDPDDKVKSLKEQNMRIADLIPVYFTVDVVNIFKQVTQGFLQPLHLDFDTGIREFNLKTSQVGLASAGGLRVWMTSEANTTESLTNSYKDNKVVESYDKLLDATSGVSDWAKSMGKRFGTIHGLVSGEYDTISAGLALMDGRQLSLPRIWNKSEYTSGFTLSVRLISPYGSPTAFRKYVGEPLLYLISLVSPASYDGVTYGLPPFVHIRSYGGTHIPIAVPQSLTINRNFAESRVNKYKQPLDITVNIEFEQALPGFGALLQGGDISDANALDSIMTGSQSQASNVPGISTLGSFIESMRPYDSTFNSQFQYDTPASGTVPSIPEEFEDMFQQTIDMVNDSIDDIGEMVSDDTSEEEQIWET